MYCLTKKMYYYTTQHYIILYCGIVWYTVLHFSVICYSTLYYFCTVLYFTIIYISWIIYISQVVPSCSSKTVQPALLQVELHTPCMDCTLTQVSLFNYIKILISNNRNNIIIYISVSEIQCVVYHPFIYFIFSYISLHL